jgi:hypothetical protein
VKLATSEWVDQSLTQADIDAMLREANTNSVYQDLIPEAPAEVIWTCSASAAGAILGLVGCGLVCGGWLSALLGGVGGYLAGLGTAVVFWRLTTTTERPTCWNLEDGDPDRDDLLDTW